MNHSKPREQLDRVIIRFAGDSGDGMQLTGDRFTQESAVFGNDLVTLPNFPAEIRAPQGTIPGVSSFQIHFADHDILTAGDTPDVLVAMNPAALKANASDLHKGATIIVDTGDFSARNLSKAGYPANPLELLGTADDVLADFQVHPVDLTGMTIEAVKEFDLSRKDASRAKNMFALGLLSWMYGRPLEPTIVFLEKKFAQSPAIASANVVALKTGWNFGETTESFAVQYEVAPATFPAGTYRNISGNLALAYGLVAGGVRTGLPVFLGSYPITPASDILHELSKHKALGVTTFQAEDEIAGVGAAIGASFGGSLGVTTTSGPGFSLKSEAIGLAIMMELPMVVVNVQRGGPSTGLPTKTEQSDLLQAMFGRNGEAPIPVIAPQSPGDCFAAALEATRIAVTYRTPVVLLSVGYLANGSGEISYEPANHDLMVRLRQAKIDGIKIPDLVVDDPTGDAELLLLGWGSYYGPIAEACRRVRRGGVKVAQAHLRYLNPLPANLGEVLRRYPKVVLPEMNLGQLALLLRGRYLVDIQSVTKVAGKAFLAEEVEGIIDDALSGTLAARENEKASLAKATAVTIAGTAGAKS
jgi:2-oxoglutarate ferredoxin oxidoreductase subunit alpha